MRRKRAAKIVSTLGPASSTPEKIAELFLAGADVFRLNFSHGTHEEHAARYQAIRQVEEDFNRPIGVLIDLQGPKIRVDTFTDGTVLLEAGDDFVLDSDRATPGNKKRVSISNPEIFPSLENGVELLLDDGKIRLVVKANTGPSVLTEVIVGGSLSDNKGLNIPGAVLPMSAMTEKDIEDLQFGLDLGVDWVALSFVQRPEDIADAKAIIKGRAGVLAKLEKPLAIKHLTSIVEMADAVMVARGDLGVEAPPEEVPGIQKQIIRQARMAGKPVIVATQMLESMISSPTPTRAEASDVATAIFEGADAVMLSAETATGEYPVEAVSMMERIIEQVENDENYELLANADQIDRLGTDADAITSAARQIAMIIDAAAIVTFTSTGSTTFRAAKVRPTVPILGLTPELSTSRRLVLVWGVHPVRTQDVKEFADVVADGISVSAEEGFAKKGDNIVITAGVPFGRPGTTNIIRIASVD